MSVPSELSVAVLGALESALSGYLQLDPESFARLQSLEGKVIALEVSGLDLRFHLLPGRDGIRVMGHYAGVPDTVISGTPGALLRMSLAADPARSLLGGEVRISGDIELGQRFKRLLDQLHVDWEEQLAGLTGDVIAHKLGNLARGSAEWGRRAGTTLSEDLADYLRFESGDLPARFEVEEFMDAVDTLRDDVERMEARVRRLRALAGGAGSRQD